MSKYECAVVFAPSVADDELPQQVDRVKDWLTGIGAEISELDIWGRRKLAYPIRKYLEGIYLFCYFDIPDATRLREVDRRFNNAEEVLRHLVIRLPDLKELPRVKVEEEPEAKKEEEPEAKKEEEGEAKVEGEAKKEEEGEAKVEGEAKPEGESKAEGEAKPEGESKAEGEGGEEKKETTSPAVVASTEAPVAQSASSPESGETGGETPAPAPEPEPEPTVELEESQPPAQAEASESSESEKKD